MTEYLNDHRQMLFRGQKITYRGKILGLCLR